MFYNITYKLYYGGEKNAMGRDDEIQRLLQYLQNEGIRATKDFVKDIKRLVLTDIKTFASQIFKDFSRKNYNQYNRFEQLKLTKVQKEEIDGYELWRYEYRNTSNLRCIFILEKGNNSSDAILICAFNENGNKKKGENSYSHNIERAIEIIKRNA